jgi:ATP adenylyltransferase
MLEFITLTRDMKEILIKKMNPDGFNLGINLGKIAGAGVEDHIHFHIVPRWNGDTNFMPVIVDTKVIPQSLDDLYIELKSCF